MADALGNLGRIKQLYAALRNTGDPTAMLNAALQQNPQLKAVMDASGGDCRKAFYAYAERMGATKEQADRIVNALK